MGIIRHVLTAAGGIAIATGYVTAGEVEVIVGAVVTLAGVAWSIWDKKA